MQEAKHLCPSSLNPRLLELGQSWRTTDLTKTAEAWCVWALESETLGKDTGS